jgi:hypothetical protein
MFPTFILDIKLIDNKQAFDRQVYNYTGLFYKLYNNFELSKDKSTVDEWKKQYNASYDSFKNCETDVKMTLISLNEIKQEKERTILEIKKQIDILNKKNRLTKYEKKYRLKLRNKLKRTEQSLNKDVCFGGKQLLREITKLSQLSEPTEKQLKSLYKKKKEFSKNRKRNIFLQGRACEGGNRYIEFHLTEGYIIFKPNKDIKIKIDFYIKPDNKKRNRDLAKIQQMVDNNELAVTLRLDENKICLTFDIEELNGYGFDEKTYNILKKNKTDQEIKQIKFDLYKEQKERKFVNKIKTRCAGIDMNPDEIGFSIVDINPTTNEIKRVIFTRRYDLRLFTEAVYVNKNKSQYLRNKHKTEIQNIYVDIFKWITHYKVSHFGIEDLTNITNTQVDNSKTFNRKTKNVWCRGMQENLAIIKCGERGVELVRVDAKYSSVIGNILHYQYHDCIGASIEIGRRSYTKYIKNCHNSIYPTMENYNSERLNHLAGIAVPIKNRWQDLSKVLNKKEYGIGGWWRNKLSTEGKNLNSPKSMVTFYCK